MEELSKLKNQLKFFADGEAENVSSTSASASDSVPDDSSLLPTPPAEGEEEESVLLRAMSLNTRLSLECFCMGPLIDPVTLPCGDNLCKECIENHLKTEDKCPCCSKLVPAYAKSNLGINLSLKGFVEKAYPSPHVASSAPAPPPAEGEEEESVLLRAMSLNTRLSLECFCMGPLIDPVTLPCGHNFCKDCIRQHFTTSMRKDCPNCRKPVPYDARGNLNVNVSLKRFVEKAHPRAHENAAREKAEAEERTRRDLLDRTDGRTLHEASSSGRIDVVRLLLDRGAAIDATAGDGGTPLHLASSAGHIDVVRLLLDRGAAIDATDGDSGSTPLHVASGAGDSGCIDAVRLLLDRGAAIDATDAFGGSALHRASDNGCIDIVRLLLDRSAAVDATDAYDRSPLHDASSSGHIDIVRLLLDRGAAIDATDGIGRAPLHVASDYGHIDVVRLLLDRGAAPLPL